MRSARGLGGASVNLLALQFGICGAPAACAAPAEPLTPQHASAPAPHESSRPGQRAPDEPAPADSTGLWAPPLPRAAEARELAWAQVELSGACAAGASVNAAGPVQIVTGAEQFEALFCRKTNLDWSRYRVVWSRLEGNVHDVDVVQGSERLDVFVGTHRTCDAAWGSDVALLVADTARAIALTVRPEPAPSCPDGHAY